MTHFNTGFEGQRKADLGNGKYLNPIISGDHPDPTILKDGEDYYMTFSSFLSYPGIVIWHSLDLVNWAPVCTALTKPIGSVWALDLIKHGDRYFIYIPAVGENHNGIYVIWADKITGPWSDPIDLGLTGCIDPGHAVGEDGKRYLFVNGIRRIGLTDDGLSTVGELVQAYNPWRYPEDWVVEMFAPEGPKIFRRAEYFYLVSAVGGTSGPATSHMIIVARSKSILGPWQDCPANPIVRTQSEAEPWWSRGHATVVEGPAGDWWMVYHGYENGFRTLGRQTLLEPVRWTKDGWIEALGGDLSSPIRKPRLPKSRCEKPANGQSTPASQASPAGFPLSDDFSTDKMGLQWCFFNPAPGESRRAARGDKSLVIQGKGSSLADCSPLTFIAGDLSYEMEVSLEPSSGNQGGLILYYSERMYCGLGFDGKTLYTYHNGQEHSWMRMPLAAGKIRLRLQNHRHVITLHYAGEDGTWRKHPWQMETSGFHHNVFGGFTALKPGIFSLGTGSVRFENFTYKGL